jgi:ferredoxin
MKVAGHEVLICNCERSMTLDGKRIARALGVSEPAEVASHLCRTETGRFTGAIERDTPLLVACTQEAPLFRELARETGRETPFTFTNIRERAGWTTAKGDLSPKVAALLAEALVEVEPTGSMTITSEGQCLVYGKGQEALETARRLQGRLNVTLLLSESEDVIPPSVVDVPICRGRIVKAQGHFGAFEVTVDGYAPAVPSSRSRLEFIMPRDGSRATCSLILDLSGGTPLFPGAERREGYLRAEPGDPAALARAMFDISDLVGEFEKPLYVHYDPELCSHARSRKIGCTRCLDVCPAAAITPDGDYVRIDPVICGGCGACSAVCPTGAASYRLPRRSDLIRRIQALLSTYLKAGGATPQLLIHDERHGGELISLSARFGRGLPVDVLPLAVNEVTQVGHDAMLAALAAGASRIVVLADPRKAGELAGTVAETALVNAVMEGLGFGVTPFVEVAVENDPDRFDQVLWDGPKLLSLSPHAFAPAGLKRDVARTALSLLHGEAPRRADIIELPKGAPYGRILVDQEKCTLCLACVSACPRDAIHDDPEKPQLKFVEAACVQCGLCRVTCPESAIMLEARYDFTPAALSPILLNEEEPFHCIRCGKPFGTAASVKRIQEKLAGRHSMFMTEAAQQLIEMCDNCRIVHQAESETNPLALAPRPKIRTTEDYVEAERRLKEARAAGRAGLTVDDFLMDN